MQKRIEQHGTKRIPLIFAYQGNIIIARLSDNDETVDAVLGICKSVSITLNFAKCKFCMRSLHFSGR